MKCTPVGLLRQPPFFLLVARTGLTWFMPVSRPVKRLAQAEDDH
jgi:hypothetical protein